MRVDFDDVVSCRLLRDILSDVGYLSFCDIQAVPMKYYAVENFALSKFVIDTGTN